MNYLNKVFDCMDDAVVITDPFKKIITRCNAAVERIFGYSPESLIGISPEILHKDQQDYIDFGLKVRNSFSDKGVLKIDHVFRHKNGQSIVCENTFTAIYNDTGGIELFVNLVRDVTGQRKMILDLKDSENRFRTIFDQAAIGVAQANVNTGQFVKVNKMLSNITGYTEEELLTRTFMDISHPDELEENDDLNSRLISGEIEIFSLKKKYITKQNTPVWVHITVSPMWQKGDKPDYTIAVIKDITSEKLSELALQDSEQQFKTIFDHAPVGVGLVETATGKIIKVNKQYCDILGYSDSEIVGKRYQDFTYPDDHEADREISTGLLKGNISEFSKEKRYYHKNGSVIHAILTVSAIRGNSRHQTYNISIIQDITETKNMRDEIIKSQKLEALGILAGGIAHDFNNMLTAMVGNLFLAKKNASIYRNEKLERYLATTETAVMRAKELTAQLLTFSKGGTPILEDCSINDLLKESVVFILSGSKSTYSFNIADDLWTVKADAGQINQVLYNLVINADQAMKDGGIIYISAENLLVGDDVNLPVGKGKYVKISIKDTGSGIPDDILQNIFDPYFTTKKSGSGLGLATARSIIEKHNGYLGVNTEKNKKTVFYFYLPAGEQLTEIKNKDALNSLVSSGRILFMDDDNMICEAVIDILTDSGFQVEVVHDGKNAVSKYRECFEKGEHCDIVFLDLTVPGGMGGEEAMMELLKIDPDVKAIACSGYSNSPVMANFSKFGFSGILTKPFSVESLLGIVNQNLK